MRHEGLNEEQRIVLERNGCQLLIAGAGSGKTRTLIAKVNHILETGVCNKDELLLLTFSRKSAREMEERLCAASIGELQINVATFHSWCYAFLNENADEFIVELGYKDMPRLVEDNEIRVLMKPIIEECIDDALGIPSDVVYELFRKYNDSEYQNCDFYSTQLVALLEKLQIIFLNIKHENSLYEYDDLIEISIRVLENYPAIKEMVKSKIKYILVDEFQDTSPKNLNLLLQLYPNSGNFFAVGDPRQAIYGFRKADRMIIENFKEYFPNCTIHYLSRNYRSGKSIVKIANKVIFNNGGKGRKPLKAISPFESKIYLLEKSTRNLYTKMIKEIVDAERSSITVLYRNNWQGDVLENYFLNNPTENNIEFMTIHSSKGLEFDTVIIVGIEEDVFPDKSNPLSDERSLFYVGITRARKKLYLLYENDPNGIKPIFIREIENLFIENIRQNIQCRLRNKIFLKC